MLEVLDVPSVSAVLLDGAPMSEIGAGALPDANEGWSHADDALQVRIPPGDHTVTVSG